MPQRLKISPYESFCVWLLQQQERKDEIGRLARECRKDITFPKRAKNLYVFLHYYDLEPENRKAVKAAHAEWRRLRRHTYDVLPYCYGVGA